MKGKLALCSRGIPGVITLAEPKSINYPDGRSAVAYVGISLTTGKPWSARSPIILGTFEEFVDSGMSWEEFKKYQTDGELDAKNSG